MTKRLLVLFSTLLLGLIISLASPTITLAAEPNVFNPDTVRKLLTEYCTRRSTGEINLETWYGGKCNPTHVEESIGFGDIIVMHVLEKFTGAQQGAASDAVMKNIYKIFKCFSDSDPFKCATSLKNDLSAPQFALNEKDGVLPAMGNAMSYLITNPPATSVEYIASVKNNLASHNIIKPSYAAASSTGYGFQALSALLPIWRVFRDVSYLIFVFIFLYYGFMIMFRMKMVGAQTAVSLEMALPKLVVTLLLITFSYAIAGFLIDVFYLLIGFFFSLFFAAGVITDLPLAQLVSGMKLGLMIPFLYSLLHAVVLSGQIFFAILPIPSGLAQMAVSFLLSPLQLVVFIILLFALVITFGKIIWMLLQAYINMILQIIFAPVLLLGNAFPGSKSFGNWIKAIFAELMVFASVIFLFTLAFYFLGGVDFFGFGPDNSLAIGSPDKQGMLWVPPPLYPQALSETLDPAVSAAGNKARFALIGMGIILMTPKLADQIRKALQVADSGFIGKEIGDNLGAGLDFANRHPVHTPFGNFDKIANAGRGAINKVKGVI